MQFPGLQPDNHLNWRNTLQSIYFPYYHSIIHHRIILVYCIQQQKHIYFTKKQKYGMCMTYNSMLWLIPYLSHFDKLATGWIMHVCTHICIFIIYSSPCAVFLTDACLWQWRRWCNTRLLRHLKALPHATHVYGRAPLCMRKCVIRLLW